MKYAKLNKSKLKVSTIGLGTNAVGGHNLFANLKDENGIALVKKAMDLGITFIDTADAYGNGQSETLVGQVIKDKREHIILASKGGIEPLSNGSSRMNNKPEYLRKALDSSLKRLGTDYLDVYYIHWPDGETSFKSSVGELVKLKKEGMIRAIGVSNVNLEQLQEANYNNDVDFVQVRYNLLQREIEKDILPYCIAHEISVVPYGPLAFGLLAGKYDENKTFPEGDWRRGSDLFTGEAYKANLLFVEKLKMIAKSKNISMNHLALAWLLHQDGIDTVIPGAKNPKQVEDNTKAANVSFSKEELDAIENYSHLLQTHEWAALR